MARFRWEADVGIERVLRVEYRPRIAISVYVFCHWLHWCGVSVSSAHKFVSERELSTNSGQSILFLPALYMWIDCCSREGSPRGGRRGRSASLNKLHSLALAFYLCSLWQTIVFASVATIAGHLPLGLRWQVAERGPISDAIAERSVKSLIRRLIIIIGALMLCV